MRKKKLPSLILHTGIEKYWSECIMHSFPNWWTCKIVNKYGITVWILRSHALTAGICHYRISSYFMMKTHRSRVSRDALCWGVTPVSICLALPGESLVGAFLSFNKSLWFKHWRFGQTPVLRHTLHFDSVQCWFSLIAPFRLKVSFSGRHRRCRWIL